MAGIVNLQLHISLFQPHPQLKQLVRQAIERAIQELLPPVVERSIKIALVTCEQIVKKVRQTCVKIRLELRVYQTFTLMVR